ncbi:MAG: tRNA preQ1(34) S-adenosylmethionine ribosyltransferase-isomerase QueA [Planctomycetes bacterium]|nr:tRNA preQ1(34) S-adenosylmethionine ribosyltransferase-isomerase QueA [Planctomycetota bacterium]
MPFPFDYELPAELIAQEPCEPRDHARLLVVHRDAGSIDHRRFDELPEILRPGDLLVLNDTKVVPARLYGRRGRTGGKWEGLFLRNGQNGAWEMLCQARGHLAPGEIIVVDHTASRERKRPELQLTLLDRLPSGHWLAQPNMEGPPEVILQGVGHVPLPPYIRKGADRPEDRERYQTVFAAIPGAVAAPTAGLHFTPALFESLKKRGIEWTQVTLHVGLGTFQPMQTDDPAKHKMHHEWGRLSESAAEAIEKCRERGGRIVAIGTTSVRVLETAAQGDRVTAWTGEANLFIYPPFKFRAVNVLLTNFHMPRTTLLLLVAAFTGMGLLADAYQAAIAKAYRFFSYGDAMLILP